MIKIAIAFGVFVTAAILMKKKDMSYRQSILKTMYPMIMWSSHANGKKSILENKESAKPSISIYSLTTKAIDGTDFSFASLKGKKILITAGPTYEAIDPVRFIGNHSSGKMGFDIALSAANLGASVILVSGPTNCKVTNSLIEVIPVVSAQEMYDACHQYFDNVDVMIAAAAVADYKPKAAYLQKKYPKGSVMEKQLEELVKPCIEEAMKAAMGN